MFVYYIAAAALAAQPVTVRVAPYPFVPDGVALYEELAEEYESTHAGVNIDILRYEAAPPSDSTSVPLRDYDGSYYGPNDAGVGAVRALLMLPDGQRPDVVEVDTVLLRELATAKLLSAITMKPEGVLPGAMSAVTIDGVQYAVPHWVCGNFLFYRRGDAAVTSAKSWSDLARALMATHLYTEMAGSSTLGEWYLTTLLSRGENPATIADRLKKDGAGPTVDSTAKQDLETLLSACPRGVCTNKTIHDETRGYYARAFIRSEAAAYVGYSESIHFALETLRDDCALDLTCLSEGQIAVRALPLLANNGHHVGWVDGLAMSSQVNKDVRPVAEDFIRFATSRRAYDVVLTPEAPDVPRYLLPPIDIGGEDHWSAAWGALYPALWQAFQDRVLLSDGNTELRKIGKELGKSL